LAPLKITEAEMRLSFYRNLVCPIVRSTFWALTPNEIIDKKSEIAELLESIQKKIGNERSDRDVAQEIGDDHFTMDIAMESDIIGSAGDGDR
jgi:hypothetical protein